MTFEFDRYINGQLMAEGVTIERQGNLPDAMREAARIASRGPNGEVPVLVLRAEALSRTGAVKVKALVNSLLDLRDLIMRGKRCVTDTGPAVKPVIELAAVHILDDAANALEALSALEPAAPEGQQPAAYRVHAPADEHYGIGPDRLQFHPLAQYDLDNGYRQTPLYTRPAEQAVTEAMVEAAASQLGFGPADSVRIRAALKAAMEADR